MRQQVHTLEALLEWLVDLIFIPKKKSRKKYYEVVESEISASPPLWKTMRISIGNEKFAIFPLYFLEEFLIVTAKKLLSLVQTTSGRSLLGGSYKKWFL